MSRIRSWLATFKKYTAHMAGFAGGVVVVVLVTILLFINPFDWFAFSYELPNASDIASSTLSILPKPEPKLDKEEYARRMLKLANNGLLDILEGKQIATTASSTASSTPAPPPKPKSAIELANTTDKLWPADLVYPKQGAILPFNRIIAYYGNFYSVNMGVLGEYPEEQVLSMLQEEIDKWEEADPETPVVPAIDYIAVTAQGSAGADGMYRFRMPDVQIQHAIDMAAKVDGIVILEIQAGLSDLQREVEILEPFLSLPQVHLAIDPEFHMVSGDAPGTVIGSVSATEVNQAAEYLAKLVREHDLPPKVLIVHRFTLPMVRNTMGIKPLPEVQVVMDMDGWGSPAKKFGTYHQTIEPFPVQFTGFKLFYKNDLKPENSRLLTPEELLDLSPQPSFIQYQ